jgi:RIP metalloprotease RseP
VSETLPPPSPPSGPSEPHDRGEELEPTVLDRLAANTGIRLAVLLGALGWLAYTNLWMFVVVMALVVSIFLHEMGHYLVAKRNGMKVTEFFLGFGPRIWSFRRGETEYGIKLIWLGAYVKIIGMSNLEEVAPADESRSYRAKSFGRRMPVVLAGPAMNLLIGFLLLFVVIASFGRPSDTAWGVRAVTAGSAAEAAGLQPGDRIVGFDGQEVTDFESLTELVRVHAGNPAELTVERDGQELLVPVTLGWSLTAGSAMPLGLQSSDTVTQVGDTPIADYDDLVEAMQQADGPVTLTYVRDRDTLTTEVTGPVELSADDAKGFLGVAQESVYENVPLIESVGAAGSEFGNMVVGSVQGMGRLFSPSGITNLFDLVVNANDDDAAPATSSPGGDPGSGSSAEATASSSSGSSIDEDRPMSILGIVNVGAQVGENGGWAGVLVLLALVNIFLGLINLVPLLPLDGGHIVVACYEEIRSRISHTTYRVNMARLMPVTYVVFLLILGIGLSTIYLDAVDPVQLNN